MKKNNHLYRDVELDSKLIDIFESESKTSAQEFHNKTRTEEDSDKYDEVLEDSRENQEVFFETDKNENYDSHTNSKEEDLIHEKTSMFLNKYCESIDVPTVANRVADIIVNYEINQKINIADENDFEMDNEIITEEDFLQRVDDYLDNQNIDVVKDRMVNEDDLIDMNDQMDETGYEEDIQKLEFKLVQGDDNISNNLDLMTNPTDENSQFIAKSSMQKADKIKKKMEKICIAPGEHGGFQNWGADIFLEEKCFPEKFPYGIGGYLSSCVDDEERNMGFASYCVNQILSADPKFRNDATYVFFLLLVKELIHLKRCKTTYFRQATRLPTLTKANVNEVDRANLSRFNRSFQVFKSLRGTSMYYEESKKNLMSILRQNGCPSIFLTLSCAEFDWPELVKEIAETVYRKKFTDEQINQLSDKEKNKLVSENVVQSTLHFQKRIDKIFSMFEDDFFGGGAKRYHASSYFFRVEFQQRGAPHIHSLLWLRDQDDREAPNFWMDAETPTGDQEFESTEFDKKIRNDKKKIEEIQKFVDLLVSTSADDMKCENHEKSDSIPDCDECKHLKEKVEKYQLHHHTFTCAKKKKTITIKKTEGHGRLDGHVTGNELTNIPICRFKFPKFPLDETKVIIGMPKDTDEGIVKERKRDLNKIINFLIRHTYVENPCNQNDSWGKLKKMNFWEFLYAVGMFTEGKSFNEYNDEEKKQAKCRYLDAISASVQGTAIVVMKRRVKDIFTNGFNKKIMRLFKSNHDLQICIDQYAAAQYICGYITKNESGVSRLLKAVNDESTNMTQIEKLNALASVLDKHREVSIQEAIYRLLGLQMTKSSIKVKYLSTIHPHFRDGLLKGNIADLNDNESIFHNSPHQYFEARPNSSINTDKIQYDEEELKKGYWDNMYLAKFWSNYEIVYGKQPKLPKNGKTKIIPLNNGKGFIRRRSSMAVLRYYLNYTNDEDLARGLLVLFMPFRDEMKEIHTKDVKELLAKNQALIEKNRGVFEKYKLMSELISSIQPDENNETSNTQDDENEECDEIESTSLSNIEEFNKWAKMQATKELSRFNDLTTICDMNEFRLKISSLNNQQRRFFDDYAERCVSSDVNERPVYVFISGNAGTGKSFLVKLLIDAVKVIKIKPGDDLKKPPAIVMAPTANAAFIIGGKTIDSVLNFLPSNENKNKYTEASPGKMSMMRYEFEDVHTLFCDEISMVGSCKLLKINFRLQDLADGNKRQEYMGGKSFIASGNQL